MARKSKATKMIEAWQDSVREDGGRVTAPATEIVTMVAKYAAAGRRVRCDAIIANTGCSSVTCWRVMRSMESLGLIRIIQPRRYSMIEAA